MLIKKVRWIDLNEDDLFHRLKGGLAEDRDLTLALKEPVDIIVIPQKRRQHFPNASTVNSFEDLGLEVLGFWRPTRFEDCGIRSRAGVELSGALQGPAQSRPNSWLAG